VIGPSIGAFKELKERGLLFSYNSFSELETLLEELKYGKRKGIDRTLLCNYIKVTSWSAFSAFLSQHLSKLFSSELYNSAKVCLNIDRGQRSSL
jgi:hypothetical protein